jgi:branched-chain amino acid transport system substrate-binding protein
MRKLLAALCLPCVAACGGTSSSAVDAAVAAKPDAAVQPDAAAQSDAPAPDAAAPLTPLPLSNCTPIEYEGDGRPDLLIASDQPILSFAGGQVQQVNNAIRYELRQRGWKAGNYHVGFQACDDATAADFRWNSDKCMSNAKAYAADSMVVGVIGTFNSGCAAVEIPILNAAGLAMISESNTLVCLTQSAPSCDPNEPAKYYPSGTRNYVRVVANDAFQGAALAEYAQTLGLKKVYVLNDGEAYGVGVATNFKNAATFLGITIAGSSAWDGSAQSYTDLMNTIKATTPDAVFLGGIIDNNGAQLIKDKVAVLGANDGSVKLISPDGFATQDTIDVAAGAAAGMYMSIGGVDPSVLSGAAKDFADQFTKDVLGTEPIEPYTVNAAEAAVVLLEAIGKSNGTRADVIAKLFQTNVMNGLLGTFTISATGDPQNANGAITGITIYKATTKLEVVTVVSPKQATVDAALGH